jgi:hypothetical protein
MDAAGPATAAADVVGGGAPADGGSARNTLLGMPIPVAVGAAAALAALVVLVAVAFAVHFARRRGARPPSLSRVEHAPSSASGSGSASSRPASSARKDKAGAADRTAGAGAASTSDVASSSAAASSLESPVKRKPDAVRVSAGGAAAGVEMGWGRWYELAELEVATGGFCAENVVGEGGYGTVYRGVLAGGEVVAVKDLFDHK